MKHFLIFLIFLYSFQLFSQCNGRYESEIFTETSKITVEYTDVYDWSSSDSGLEMDIYTPLNDTSNNRPLLIFAHGGVYVEGDKNSIIMVTLCEAFAKRGYVTASIRYRLTTIESLLSSDAYDIFSQTVVNSVSDMKAAIRYFRKDVIENNNSYGINSNQIFVGGYSAGAVTAAHLSVIDEGQIPVEFQSFFNEAGGIEGNSGNTGYSSEVSGAILMAGAINSLDFIDANDVPVVSVHASDDNTVDYECASPLGYLGMPFLSLPNLCGSGKIHEALDNVGVLNDLYTFSSGGHSAPIVDLDGTVIPFISEFLYNLICETTAINERSNRLFSVYPNPFSEFMNIEIHDKSRPLILTDLFGRVILEFQNSQPSIDMSELSSGTYIISTNDFIHKEIVIKH